MLGEFGNRLHERSGRHERSSTKAHTKAERDSRDLNASERAGWFADRPNTRSAYISLPPAHPVAPVRRDYRAAVPPRTPAGTTLSVSPRRTAAGPITSTTATRTIA